MYKECANCQYMGIDGQARAICCCPENIDKDERAKWCPMLTVEEEQQD